jgi:hypothetical protein
MNKNYYKPTPKRWRKIGDICLLLSVSFSGLSAFEQFKWYGIGLAILAGIGKVLTNFKFDDPDN